MSGNYWKCSLEPPHTGTTQVPRRGSVADDSGGHGEAIKCSSRRVYLDQHLPQTASGIRQRGSWMDGGPHMRRDSNAGWAHLPMIDPNFDLSHFLSQFWTGFHRIINQNAIATGILCSIQCFVSRAY